jgi:hypothetical protein
MLYAIGAFVTCWAGLILIGYFVVTAQWLPAIFVLLARKELTTWLESEAKRVIVESTEDH